MMVEVTPQNLKSHSEPTVAVIVPTLNESARIRELLHALVEAAPGQLRIIHVDDGSTDGTVEIVASCRTEGVPVESVVHPRNLGIGATFRDGLVSIINDIADKDIVVIIEGDMTNSPSLLPQLIARIQSGYDVAIASRYRPGSAQLGFPPKRKLMSWVLNRLILRLRVGLSGVRDYSIFYRAYSGRILKQAFTAYGDDLITCSGFGANAELLCKLGSLGAKCVEIPQIYDYRRCQGHSGISIGRTIREYMTLLHSVPSGRTQVADKAID